MVAVLAVALVATCVPGGTQPEPNPNQNSQADSLGWRVSFEWQSDVTADEQSWEAIDGKLKVLQSDLDDLIRVAERSEHYPVLESTISNMKQTVHRLRKRRDELSIQFTNQSPREISDDQQ